MAAPERFAKTSDSSLAPRAPSIHGTKQYSTRAAVCPLLGKADSSGLSASGMVCTIMAGQKPGNGTTDYA